MRQNASKVIILGTNMIVSGEGAQPPPSYPTPSMPTRRAPPNWNSEYIHYTCIETCCDYWPAPSESV